MVVYADSISPPLSQAVGYVVVVGVGLAIALGMVFVTRLLKRTVGEDNEKTEMFMTANRSVSTGLTSSAVISSWLWSTAMLGSSLVGYTGGIAGPFWFAAGCSPMIVFFALLGISCKRKIPEAHTLLEIIRIRYGTAAHFVWMFLCIVNNIIACANMLLGASAAITAMTGVHIIASTFLLPVGVAVYTFVGGIKATFLTDYLHTFIILIILCYFSVKVWTVDEIGSIGNLYELVKTSSQQHPIAGNHEGSYLTMTSKSSLLFGILHLLANFGLVLMDTSFFIKAFAASPKAVVPGYVIGGIAYFAIPWATATLASSVVLGLEDNPIFPTFPRRMTTKEISGGLVLPYFAITIAGKGGAVGILLITFMAVTSTLSAQVIAVSSIISFDIYRQYFNRSASDADVIRISHYGVLFFAAFAAAFSTMLHYVGVDLGWTLYMLGVLTCPGIFPTAFAILWRRQNTLAAVVSPLLGLVTGIAVWIGTAHAFYGTVSVASTGATLPCVYGTVASALSPAVYSIVLSLYKPQNYDWADFRKEKLAFDVVTTASGGRQASVVSAEAIEAQSRDVEYQASLKRWGRIAAFWSLATFLGHWVLWPLPMYAANYIFEKGFYAAWVIVAIVWLWIALFIAGFYPIIDGREQILAVIRGIGRSRSRKPASGSSSDAEVEVQTTGQSERKS